MEKSYIAKNGDKALRGFTLLELMIVIAIAGLLAALGLSSFRVIQQERYNSTVDSIAHQLEFAQSYAQGNGTYTWVGIQNDLAGGIDLAVWAASDGTANLTDANRTLIVPVKVYQNAQLTTDPNPVGTVFSYTTSTLAHSPPFQAALSGAPLSFTQVIQFAPSGGAVIQPNNTVAWVEFPFANTAGTTQISPVLTIVKVAGLTGRILTIKN